MESYQIYELTQMVLFIIGVGVLAYSPVLRGLADRIRHGRLPKPGVPDAAAELRVDELSGEVASLRQQLYETQDRLDFTERMLAQVRAGRDLPAGRE